MNGKDGKTGKNTTKEQEARHFQDPLDSPCVRCQGMFYHKKYYRVLKHNKSSGKTEKSLEIYEVGKDGYVEGAFFTLCLLCKGVLCSSNCSKLHEKKDCLGLLTWAKTGKRTVRKSKMQKNQFELNELPLGNQEKEDAEENYGKEKQFDFIGPLSL